MRVALFCLICILVDEVSGFLVGVWLLYDYVKTENRLDNLFKSLKRRKNER